MNRIGRIHDTPWGPAQHVEALLPGQVFAVSTAGHGGIYVCGAALDRIPPVFRAATFTRDPHWYEEDCDWAIVAKFLPELFPRLRAEAEAVLRDYHKGPYEAWERGAKSA